LCRPPGAGGAARARLLDYALPAGVGAIAAVLMVTPHAIGLEPSLFASRLIVATPFFIAHAFAKRPRRYALAVGVSLAASALFPGVSGPTITAARNFYGVVRVTHDDSGQFVQLVHGNTVHGMQSNAPALHDQPLGYYHRQGPLGAIFDAFHAKAPTNASVGVIGL